MTAKASVYRTGTRATRGLTVLVTDETGKPVDMAAVSFRLPDEGASGTFSSGLRTEIVTTGPDGRATVWGMQWNKTPGPVEIRITAIKEQARAGIISTQYLSDSVAPKAGGEGVFKASHGGHKWLWIAAIAAGQRAAALHSRSLQRILDRIRRTPLSPAFRSARRASSWDIRNDEISLNFPDLARDARRAAAIQPPQIGFAAMADGTLRPVYGVAGNFILGQPVAGQVLSQAFSGIARSLEDRLNA